MSQRYLLLILCLLSSSAQALDDFTVSMDSLESQGWKLTGIKLLVSDLKSNRQQLTVSIDKLSLAKPFHDLTLVNIRCRNFSWQNEEMLCKQGRAELVSKRWQSPAANFSFHIKKNDNSLTLTDVRFARGFITLVAREQSERWQVKVQANSVQVNMLAKLLGQDLSELKSGQADLELDAAGSQAVLDNLSLTAAVHGLTGQTKDGRFASELANFRSSMNASRVNRAGWQWQSHVDFEEGAIYAEPIYLNGRQQGITLDAQGLWQDFNKRLDIESASYQHTNVVSVEASAILNLNKGLSIEDAGISVASTNLDKVSSVYLQPIFTQTALEGLSFAGQVRVEGTITNQSLTGLTGVFNQISVKDKQQRLSVEGGNGFLNWSNSQTFVQPSTVAWRKLRIGQVPVDAAKLEFLTQANSIRLLHKTVLPLLGGSFVVKQFNWQSKPQQEPSVYFEGDLNQVSLEQWSKAMEWTPLSGSISGTIPKVEYTNKTLSLGGQLVIKVFDGVVRVSNLAASGLFTALPKFYSDLEVDKLDMDQLTSKFKFGGITGKLSGYVRQLYLENWQPVSFYAWFGTPDDDDSKHRISQKAVNNIASIGGGGASDLLSRSILGVFDTFGYDKIGLGCYLHDGVCQLMGIEATPQGYAIIKGGGLPRIDVIGYNPRVDWDVLLDRLKRISKSDDVVIK